MDLFEASKKGMPLIAQTGEGGDRLIAEIYPIERGAVFADVGWPTATAHPFHVLEGKVQEDEDGWRVGDTRIRVAFEGETRQLQWISWLRYLETGGKPFDRAACWKEIQASGITATE